MSCLQSSRECGLSQGGFDSTLFEEVLSGQVVVAGSACILTTSRLPFVNLALWIWHFNLVIGGVQFLVWHKKIDLPSCMWPVCQVLQSSARVFKPRYQDYPVQLPISCLSGFAVVSLGSQAQVPRLPRATANSHPIACTCMSGFAIVSLDSYCEITKKHCLVSTRRYRLFYYIDYL